MRRALALLSVLAACADEPSAPPPDDFDLAVDAHWQEVNARGVTAAIVSGGVTRTFARGAASIDEPRDMPADARMRTGSITKTFTTAVILQLVDEGKLSLDDTLDRWVPGFALGAEVTIGRALAHMTGLYNFTDDAGFLNHVATPATPAEIEMSALEHPSNFAPVQSYGYSNTNFILLGMVIEAVTGQGYADVVRARLLDPLALTNTFIEGPAPAPELVTGFLLGAAAPAYDASWAYAAGALVSNTEDLCRWADALFRGSVVPAPLLAQMTAETHPPDGTNTNYGLGTYLFKRAGRDVLGHTGSTMGFNAELFIEPVSGDCIAVLSNDFFGEPSLLAKPLWELLGEHPL